MVVDAAGEIARLQNLLKGSRGGAPKPEIVAVALAMARDPKLDRTKALSALSRGGSRTRAVEYCNRIVDENLLDCEQSVPAADPFGGLPATMHVQRTWITEHAAGLHDLSVGALALSSDGRAATRTVSARLVDFDERVHDEIVYTLPPANGESDEQKKQRNDKHRRLEEVCAPFVRRSTVGPPPHASRAR